MKSGCLDPTDDSSYSSHVTRDYGPHVSQVVRSWGTTRLPVTGQGKEEKPTTETLVSRRTIKGGFWTSSEVERPLSSAKPLFLLQIVSEGKRGLV